MLTGAGTGFKAHGVVHARWILTCRLASLGSSRCRASRSSHMQLAGREKEEE